MRFTILTIAILAVFNSCGQQDKLTPVTLRSQLGDSTICVLLDLDTSIWTQLTYDETDMYAIESDSGSATIAYFTTKVGNSIKDSIEDWELLNDSIKFKFFIQEFDKKSGIGKSKGLIINKLDVDNANRLIISETVESPYEGPNSRTWQMLFFKNDYLVIWLINNPTLIPISQFIELQNSIKQFKVCP